MSRKPVDAVVYEGTWCNGDCPHLIGTMQCNIFGELLYYDGPLAACTLKGKMKTSDIITGLQIFSEYTDALYNVGAEHDVIHVNPTAKPIQREHLEELAGLGWFQHEVECDGNFTADDYDPEEGWAARV